ncbi:MAG: C10 family peptidase [Planctomycetota bacterium]|jgi:parallel beta-helix repeat protein
MKRPGIIFTATLLILHSCSSSLLARLTTAEQAEKVVTGWLRADAQPLGAALGRQLARLETFTSDTGEPIYYIVYLQPSGFVVVPADDLVEPIIGFAAQGTYDPSLDNPLGALVTSDLKGRIAAVRDTLSGQASALEGTLEARAKWEQLRSWADGIFVMGIGSISDVRVAPLMKSNWAQTYVFGSKCYNYYTPKQYPCGCVATATAQLMRYHQHPTDGIGSIGFSITIDGGSPETWYTRGGDGEGGDYHWSDMVLDPNLYTGDTERAAIGALCYDAGLSVNMNYDDDESVADTLKAAMALTTTFDYGNAVKGYNSGSEIGGGLTEMINPNLDAKDPVLLAIKKWGTSIGHAIVCDGYGYNAETLYRHLNMGWSDTHNDVWYNLPTVVTTNPDRTYDTVYKCIYNIRVTKIGDAEIISGRVYDANGEPIPNPIVYADPNVEPPISIPAESDGNGIYAFDSLESNKTYIVCPLVNGYAFTSQEVTTGRSADNNSVSGNVWGIDFYGQPLEITNITPGAGPIGSYIRIEGENFGSSPGYVIFAGGDWGEEVQWSDTVVYCRVPEDALSGEVKIATAGSALSTGRYFEVTSPATIYVDDDTGEVEDGTAEYPLGRIQLGIKAVATHGAVIVSPGTYYENIYPDGKIITLTGTEPNDPNVTAATIIDGNQIDTVVTFDSNEDANFLLTGFTITNGYSEWDGGGIYCFQSSPTISYCIIRNNSSDSGGGGIRCLERSSPVISYCTVSENSAGAYESGGGICCINDSNAVISYCAIEDNTAGYGGGGMYSNRSNPTLTNCTFSNNSMTDDYTYGGGVHNYESSPKLINCEFVGNSASWRGGGMNNNNNCNPTLVGCVFSGNTAGDGGGAMSNMDNSPVLINCTFSSNSADNDGGAMCNFLCSAALTNCLFTGNSAGSSTGNNGGAIFGGESKMTITNCTFSDNFAGDKGGAMYNEFGNFSNNNPTLANCILWGNSGSQIHDYYATTTVTYSDVEGGRTGTGNINNDPLLANPGYWADINDPNVPVEPNDPNAVWIDGNYHLQYDSPCIDVGDNTAVPADTVDIDGDANTIEPAPFDLDGHPRFADGDCNDTEVVDMGAYEFAFAHIGDFDDECDVDFDDFAVFALAWMTQDGQAGYTPVCDISVPADRYIDWHDLDVLTDHWLAGK